MRASLGDTEMKGADTVLNKQQILDLFPDGETIYWGACNKLLNAQAEISYKMGYNQALKDIESGLSPSVMV